MSEMGQKRTSGSRSGMSALSPKADIFSGEIDVCFVPRTDNRNTPFSPFPIIL